MLRKTLIPTWENSLIRSKNKARREEANGKSKNEN